MKYSGEAVAPNKRIRYGPADAIKWIRFMLDKPSGLFAIPFYTTSRDLTLRRLSLLNLLFCLSSDRQV